MYIMPDSHSINMEKFLIKQIHGNKQLIVFSEAIATQKENFKIYKENKTDI